MGNKNHIWIKEIHILEKLKNFPNLHELFGHLKPDIQTFAHGGENGSFYCTSSEIHNLQHEKMIIPLRILNMSYEHTLHQHYNMDATKIRDFLNKLDVTFEIFRGFGCPRDIINLLFQYIWK